MSVLLCSALLPLIALILSMLEMDFGLKWLFVAGYTITAGAFFIYFFHKKRYKRVVFNEEYYQRYYRISAILYPILCIVFMFACFMTMCMANQVNQWYQFCYCSLEMMKTLPAMKHWCHRHNVILLNSLYVKHIDAIFRVSFFCRNFATQIL